MRKETIGPVETMGMLQNTPLNIMYADRDLTITYINPKSMETLKRIERYLPIPVSKVLGSSIDIFHKNPSHQRMMLSNPKNLPHRAGTS